MPTLSTATPDMTSPDTPGQHLSKFEKRPKMPHPMAFDRILVARCFGGLLVKQNHKPPSASAAVRRTSLSERLVYLTNGLT